MPTSAEFHTELNTQIPSTAEENSMEKMSESSSSSFFPLLLLLTPFPATSSANPGIPVEIGSCPRQGNEFSHSAAPELWIFHL